MNIQDHLYEVIIGTLTLLTLIVTSVRQYFTDKQRLDREEKERQWDREDREQKAKEVADHLRAETARLEASSRARSEHVIEKINQNTEVSVKAFNEANSVNEKLLRIHEDVKQAVSAPPGPVTTINVNKPSE